MKNLFTLIFLSFVGFSNAQYVTTGVNGNSSSCVGYAQIQDSSAVTAVLNWKPTVQLEEGLSKTIEYFSKELS